MNVHKLVRDLFALASIAVVGLVSVGPFAQATPPGRINYQGVLRDSSGVPLNGSVTMTFRFYDAASAGTLLWEEVYDPTVYPPQLTVSSGLFTIALGNSAHRNGGSEALFPDVFANHPGVYLAVRVAADAEMTPRVQVVSAPFAVSAAKLEGRGASTFANTVHTHAGGDVTTAVANATHAATADSATNATNATTATNATNAAHATSADSATNADTVDSQHAAYFLNTSYTAQTKSGKLFLSAGLESIGQGYHASGGLFTDSGYSGLAKIAFDDCGVWGQGNGMGGFFMDSDGSGDAYAGWGDWGIMAEGNEGGGYFRCKFSSGYSYVAIGDYGIQCFGNTAGGYFSDLNSGGSYANVGYDKYGIYAVGINTGGYFANSSSGYANVGSGANKIAGTGADSFIQDHPTERDRVIVYVAPEGDEVATYTRGTAKLVNGEARVKLGETFQWVTNPDLGLTAHLTPKGDCNGLYAESVSTAEMVVRELNGGKSNAAFDYLIYGLRIGFEEFSIVQEKQRESYIPSFKDHRERYAKYPQLRAFDALERFKGMESSVRGVPDTSLDLSRARALKDAIHEYDPATDPPVEKLFGFGVGRPADTPPAPPPLPNQLTRSPMAATSTSLSSSAPKEESTSGDAGAPLIMDARNTLPCLPVSDAVEPGDVVVMDPANEKHVVRCILPADPLVVGIAAGRVEECRKTTSEEASTQVPVATSGIVPCKVDAGFGPIRRGDLLVASPNPGHAMRALESTPGTVIGKALEAWPTGTGLIKVLVMLR